MEKICPFYSFMFLLMKGISLAWMFHDSGISDSVPGVCSSGILHDLAVGLNGVVLRTTKEGVSCETLCHDAV